MLRINIYSEKKRESGCFMALSQRYIVKWKKRLAALQRQLGEWQTIINEAKAAFRRSSPLAPGVTSFQRRTVKKTYKGKVYEYPVYSLGIPKNFHHIAEYLEGATLDISMEKNPFIIIILLKPHFKVEPRNEALPWPPGEGEHMEFWELSRTFKRQRRKRAQPTWLEEKGDTSFLGQKEGH